MLLYSFPPTCYALKFSERHWTATCWCDGADFHFLTEVAEEVGHGLILGHVNQSSAQAEVREDEEHLFHDVIDVWHVLASKNKHTHTHRGMMFFLDLFSDRQTLKQSHRNAVAKAYVRSIGVITAHLSAGCSSQRCERFLLNDDETLNTSPLCPLIIQWCVSRRKSTDALMWPAGEFLFLLRADIYK